MTKNDLCEVVAASTGMSKSKVSQIVQSALDHTKTALAAGDDVVLAGFGQFKSIKKPERLARNPKTGEQVTVAAKTTVKFKPSSAILG